MTYIYNFADVASGRRRRGGRKGRRAGQPGSRRAAGSSGFRADHCGVWGLRGCQWDSGAHPGVGGAHARRLRRRITRTPRPQSGPFSPAAPCLPPSPTSSPPLMSAFATAGEPAGDRPGDGDGESAGAPVAVRSSATAEDLASASFAGQQETYLNVRGAEALDAAVIDCWSSLWTARAMAYRDREGIAPGDVRLAVVVQRMVEAEAAGVMFTANPANGRRDQIAISAAWGLGESVVSGTVTTDDLVVEAGTGRVLSRRTADKEVMTVYADARGGPRLRRRPGPRRPGSGRPGSRRDDRAAGPGGASEPGRARRRSCRRAGPLRNADCGLLRNSAGHRMGTGRR